MMVLPDNLWCQRFDDIAEILGTIRYVIISLPIVKIVCFGFCPVLFDSRKTLVIKNQWVIIPWSINFDIL